MITLTIPRNLIKKNDLVIIPRKEYEVLLSAFKVLKEKKSIKEKDILFWSKKAKKLKKEGGLSVLCSLEDLR
jgi:hypothetical protein